MILNTVAVMKANTKNLATKKKSITARDKPKNILNGRMMVCFMMKYSGNFRIDGSLKLLIYLGRRMSWRITLIKTGFFEKKLNEVIRG